ncbi:MAG TPA: hypothetical protein VNJ04_12360, partial [Gemmatimonadaceae bacterium]|nr:hypothetical protein [Gemmatimonadaceae bacterium]
KRAAEKAERDAERAAEKAAEAAAQVAEDLRRSIQQGFSTFFQDTLTNGLSSFKSLFASIKQLFLKMVADMLAARVMKRMAGVFGGMGLGAAGATAATGRGAMIGATLKEYGSGALAGGMVGYGVGSSTGSMALGGLAGGVTGAAVGAKYGGAPGAAIGAVVGLAAGIIGAGNAAKKAAKEMKTLQEALALAMDQVRAQVEGNTLKAALAQNKAQFDALKLQINAAYAGKKNEEERNKLREEANQLEATRANQIREEIALTKQRAAEDLQVRSLVAAGRSKDAAALTFTLAQERELSDARRNFATAAELATLAEVHASERAQRTADLERDRARGLEDLNLRLDIANGLSEREADNRRFEIAQRREFEDAQRSGADATTLATLKTVQAAEAAQRTADLERARARALEDLNVRLAIANGLAGDALDNLRFEIEQRREYEDAVRAGRDATYLATLAEVQAAEAKQRAADMERARTRALEDLSLRLAIANGLTEEEAENRRFAIAQIREYQDAQRAGKDEAYLATLQQVLLAEAHKRTTDKIRATIAQLSTTITSLEEFKGSLKLSGMAALSPIDQMEEARRQYQAVVEKARGGDQDAAGRLPGAANAYLTASQTVNASGPGFADDFNRVLNDTDGLIDQFKTARSVAQQQLDELIILHKAADDAAAQAVKDAEARRERAAFEAEDRNKALEIARKDAEDRRAYEAAAAAAAALALEEARKIAAATAAAAEQTKHGWDEATKPKFEIGPDGTVTPIGGTSRPRVPTQTEIETLNELRLIRVELAAQVGVDVTTARETIIRLEQVTGAVTENTTITRRGFEAQGLTIS